MLCAIILLISGCKDDEEGTEIPQVLPNLVETAVANGYNTFAAALAEAGLTDDLQGEGPYTIFAPTDAAFYAIGITPENVGDIDSLEARLQYHIIGGRVFASDFRTMNVKTLYHTATIAIDASALTINTANIIIPFDVEASNGLIHSIDAVLSLPIPTIVDLTQTHGDLSILDEALTKFPDLITLLEGEGSYTFLAPTDAAFNQFLGLVGQADVDDLPDDVLKRILQYHIIESGALESSDLADGQTQATALSEADLVTIGVSGESVSFNDANVTAADIIAKNGVLHVIDAVLVPTQELGFINTIVEAFYFNQDFTSLTEAVVNAGLLETLMDKSVNITLFAPTNEGFEAAGIISPEGIEAEALSTIIKYHLVETEMFSSELPTTEGGFATPVPTLNGDFYISNNTLGVYINGNSEVVELTEAQGDLDYDNGIVHFINRALIPQEEDIITRAQAAGFTDFVEALTEAGLVSVLQDPEGPFTVFAPTNVAFQALYSSLGIDGPAEIDEVLLEDILLYHIQNGRMFSPDISDGMSISTLSDAQGVETTNLIPNVGDTITLTDYDPDIEDPIITATDSLAGNGVIHIIDGVLLPVDLDL